MKKSLVLAMAMALGVTASAYAANPFSDVPAGHWAYDSINKLAAAGVIEGYGDTTFGGDKLMTRYEMAQIVAKAMARGANVDKLAAEFADELDNLGVRVANLEKKADNVKITGEVRFDYRDTDNYGSSSTMRNRLWVTGEANEDWSYTAMIENTQDFAHSDSGEETTKLRRAWVDGRIGGLTVKAGRWDECTSTANILDAYIDAVKVSYGDKVKIWGLAGKAADGTAYNYNSSYDEEKDAWTMGMEDGDRLYIAGIEAQVGAVDAYFNYFNVDGSAKTMVNDKALSLTDKEIYNVGVAFDLAKDLRLGYEYMWGDKKIDKRVSKDGYVARLDYKGADAATAGSWGLHAQYFDQPINAIISPTTDANVFDAEDGGYKGWNVGADVALAKNITLCVNYYDTEAKGDSSKDDKVLYSELYFNF
ncbi:MAG: S-layer homology domain-containing protein [Phascolarctobacterium sp.]|nr:S-layer homology domain-containing protein [Phascolarctobacterium sp.]